MNSATSAAEIPHKTWVDYRADWIRERAYALIQSGRIPADDVEMAVRTATNLHDLVHVEGPSGETGKAKEKRKAS